MEDSFHFALLRISISQILKASGFDKCKPSTLNIVTDLYIQYFTKLVRECMKCSRLRNHSNVVEVQDLTQGLIFTGSIIPQYYTQSDHPARGYNYNTKSFESFVNWVKYSDSFAVSRKLNDLPTSLITNLIEKRKLDLNDGETDQEKKKRKYKERQEFYNQLKLNDGNDDHDPNHDDDDDDMVTDNDKLKWLNYLIEKDLKLGHNLKFLNTSLQREYEKFNTNPKFHPQANNNDKHDQQYHKNDHIVLSIEVENDEEQEVIRPSQKLVDALPYNVKYDEYLLQDIEPSEPADEPADEPHDDDIIPQETGFEVNDEGIGGDNNLMFL